LNQRSLIYSYTEEDGSKDIKISDWKVQSSKILTFQPDRNMHMHRAIDIKNLDHACICSAIDVSLQVVQKKEMAIVYIPWNFILKILDMMIFMLLTY